jgi:hypothetical protein
MNGGGDQARAAVRLLIAILCAGALLLIFVITVGSELSETSGKAAGSVMALALFSLTAATGKFLVARRPELALFGYLCAIVSLIAFVTVFAAIWSGGWFFDERWRIMLMGIPPALALAGGNASLLLGSARPDDSEAVQLARVGTLLAIGVLALMAVVEITAFNPGREVGPEAISIVVVLYALGTVLIPLFRWTSTTRQQ